MGLILSDLIFTFHTTSLGQPAQLPSVINTERQALSSSACCARRYVLWGSAVMRCITSMSGQVIEKLNLAETTAVDIDRLRDGYRPAARRGAILFSVLSEMALVNIMYQYSLVSFLEVFTLSLRKSMPSPILLKRLKNIMDTLTFNTYNYGCTG